MADNKMTSINHSDQRLKLSFVKTTGIIISDDATKKVSVFSQNMNEVAKYYDNLYKLASDHFTKYKNNYDNDIRKAQLKASNSLDNYADAARKRANQMSSVMQTQVKDKKVRDLTAKLDKLIEILKSDPDLKEKLEEIL